MSDGLIDFLRQRIAEDEAAARSARASQACRPPRFLVGPLVTHHIRLTLDAQLAIDPARVLAEVQAKRAILDELERLGGLILFPDDPTDIEITGAIKGLSGAAHHLAAAYADHADFDQRWSLPERTTE